MEKFWTKCRPGEEKMKMLLAEQLRSAVPNEHSIDNKAKKIAQILNSEERVNVNWKTVRNWLNEIHLPHMRYLPALAALIGTEFVFRFIFGGDDS